MGTSWLSPEGAMWDGMGLGGGGGVLFVYHDLRRLGIPLLPGKARGHLHMLTLKTRDERETGASGTGEAQDAMLETRKRLGLRASGLL